jgi:glutathione synthase/RimK-type ligase-like ATP-grasp enzyme
MVQRHTPGFEDPGERALVWIDGELTHAVRKSPRFEGGAEQVSEALPLSREERALAEKAIARVEGELLYARVDVVADADGTLLVSELELMEPSLFLLQNPPALERFVRAIARRAG